MKKIILPLAVAFAAFSVSTVNAAIDDAGMRYVSASEGFGGSLRVNLLKDTNKKADGIYSTLGSTRLYVVGDVDLGGGLSSTYFWEWRTEDDKTIKTDSVHAGLKGPFGEIRAGIVEPVASAFIPSDDVTNDVGPGGTNLFGTSPNVIRWVSPEINGVLVGAAVQMKGDNKETIDKFDVVITYTLPQGLSLGAGYENSKVGKGKDSNGFRVGGQYGQDNWLIAYNYRAYDNFVRDDTYRDELFNTVSYIDYQVRNSAGEALCSRATNPLTIETCPNPLPAILPGGLTEYKIDLATKEKAADASKVPGVPKVDAETPGLRFAGTAPAVDSAAAKSDRDALNAIYELTEPNGGYVKNVDYSAHSMSANIIVDKFTFAVGYQKETVEYKGRTIVNAQAVDLNGNGDATDTGEAIGDVSFVVKGRELSVDTLSFDVAYNLGSKSKLIAAYQTKDGLGKDSVDTTYLLYRVDF